MTPADKPRKQPKKLAFTIEKKSVNRKHIPVICGVHTSFIDGEGNEVILISPSMTQLEKAFDRFTYTEGEFDRQHASEVIIIGLERFNRTRWNRRKTPTHDLPE